MLPAASYARMVMVFEPRRKGMGPVFQKVVPEAVPVRPLVSVQVTRTTPDRSVALPAITAVLALVATLVVAGEVIVSVGPAVSPAAGSVWV